MTATLRALWLLLVMIVAPPAARAAEPPAHSSPVITLSPLTQRIMSEQLAQGGAEPRPMRWAIVGGLLGGMAIPTIGNTAYLLDRNGPNWYAAQKAIDQPLLLLWANTWLYGGVGLFGCPTGALLLYMGADGRPSQALGGWIYGLLTGIVSLPVGMVVGAAVVRPMRGYAYSAPVVYVTYSAVAFATMTTGSLVGFNLAGGKISPPTSGPKGWRIGPVLLDAGRDRGLVPGTAFSGRF